MTSNRTLVTWVTVLCLVALAAPGHSTALTPFIDLQETGLNFSADGEGLMGWDGSARTLTLGVGGNVRFALLYWAGRERPCTLNGAGTECPFTQPYKDQQVLFNGTALTGTVIGSETQAVTSSGVDPILNVGYFADVTSLVSAAYTTPGSYNFTFADGNSASNLWRLNGVSLIVGYTDAAETRTFRVLVSDGLDLAFGTAPQAENQVTAATLMNHGANNSARTADLLIVLGDGTFDRPDNVTITNNPTQFNMLDSSSGLQWDTDTVAIDIPTGVGGTTVQTNSAPNNQNPDSLLWEVLALRVEQLDTEVPDCPLQFISGPPAQVIVSVRDTGSGLSQILVTKSENADTVVPPFTPGSTDTVTVTATKINSSQTARVEMQVADLAGNAVICDPIHVLLVRDNSEEASLNAWSDVPQAEDTVTIRNGSPGMKKVVVTVNGIKFKANNLRDGEERTLNISSALTAGNNSVELKGNGKKGSSAEVLIWEGE
jgi:hypothetical protein